MGHHNFLLRTAQLCSLTAATSTRASVKIRRGIYYLKPARWDRRNAIASGNSYPRADISPDVSRINRKFGGCAQTARRGARISVHTRPS